MVPAKVLPVQRATVGVRLARRDAPRLTRGCGESPREEAGHGAAVAHAQGEGRQRVVEGEVPAAMVIALPVRDALVRLVGAHRLGREREREARVVAHHDLNDVAHLGVQRRSEQSEVLPLGRARRERLEGVIRVRAEHGLAVHGANPGAGAFLSVRGVGVRKGLARAVVDWARRVVPVDLVDANEVGARGVHTGDEPDAQDDREHHGRNQDAAQPAELLREDEASPAHLQVEARRFVRLLVPQLVHHPKGNAPLLAIDVDVSYAFIVTNVISLGTTLGAILVDQQQPLVGHRVFRARSRHSVHGSMRGKEVAVVFAGSPTESPRKVLQSSS